MYVELSDYSSYFTSRVFLESEAEMWLSGGTKDKMGICVQILERSKDYLCPHRVFEVLLYKQITMWSLLEEYWHDNQQSYLTFTKVLVIFKTKLLSTSTYSTSHNFKLQCGQNTAEKYFRQKKLKKICKVLWRYGEQDYEVITLHPTQ